MRGPSAKSESAQAPKRNGSAQLAIDFESERKRRLRYGPLPKPPETVEVPYAKCNDDDFDAGEAVAWLMSRPEWQETIGAECDAVEGERPRKGPQPSYSTRELESAVFFQVMSGLRTYRAARDRLAGDRSKRSRAALDFDRPRETRCPQELTLYVGVPSEATVCRHRKRFPHERRLDAYQRYFDRLRRENAQDPELREGLRLLGIDGSAQLTSLTCPKANSETGEVGNASRVTCPEGGYAGSSFPPEKQGQGFGVVTLTASTDGLPWAYDHTRVHDNEGRAAVRALEDFREKVLPYTGPRRLSVLTADSAFTHKPFRSALRDLGIIENVHEVSHAKGRETTDEAQARAARRELDITEYPNWYANGHRELKCRCGKAHTFRRFELRAGRAVARVEGRCDACGHITITAGKWKTVHDTSRRSGDPRGKQRLVRVQPGDPEEVVDWAFGNPLSFNDPIAKVYGDARFGQGEGFHGTAVKRFKLLKTKGYYRTKAQAELHTLMVFCSMHGLTMRQRERHTELEAAA